MLNGNKETILHNLSYGQNPISGVILDPAGNLYGTTIFGGDCFFCGTVFKRDATGKWILLYTFGPDETLPYGGLILDATGNLYGTTALSGRANVGTVFKIAV